MLSMTSKEDSLITIQQDVGLLVKCTSVLEHILASEKIREVVSSFSELTNALNNNLDLAQKLTEDSSVPALLGPKLWRTMMSSVYSRSGRPENEIQILSVLNETLKIEGIAEIITNFPEFEGALKGNQNFATAIVYDGTTSQLMDNGLWRELVSIMNSTKSQKVQQKDLSKDSENVLSDVKFIQALLSDVQQLREEFGQLMEVVDCTFRDTIDVELALKLLPVASQYKMKNLSRRLVAILKDNLLLENCIRVLKVASKAEVDDLCKLTQDAITCNFKLVSEKAFDFIEFTFRELYDFVLSETLTAQEGDVFDAICKWVKTDLKTRKCHLPVLLQGVRFTCCNLETLKRIKDHYLLMDQNEVHSVLESLIQLEVNSPGHLELLSQEDRRSVPNRIDWCQWTVPDDVLFVIGGWKKGTDDSFMETYNYKLNHWIDQSDIKDPPRGKNVCAVIGHCIIVVEYSQKRVRSFNTVTRSWTLLSPMPEFREGLCLAEVERRVYAMGGKMGLARLNSCHAFDIKTNTWTEVSKMSELRSSAAATNLNGLVYCAGGYDGSINLSSVEVFHPTTNTWSFISPMTEARCSHCLVTCGDFLWAVGGAGLNKITNVLERYNPVTDVWTVMSPIPSPRYFLSAAVLKGQIFTIGGYNELDQFDVTEIYDPTLDRWSSGARLHKPRSFSSACVICTLANASSYTG